MIDVWQTISKQFYAAVLKFDVMNTRVLARSGGGALKPRLGESTLTANGSLNHT